MNSSTSFNSGLLRAIGTWGLAAAIFNCTVGGGIFRLPGTVYKMAGSYTPMVYLVCTLIMLLVALCFAKLGKQTLRSGGPYAYAGAMFGPYIGFIAGVLVWFLATVATAGVATALIGNLTVLLPAFHTPALRLLLFIVLFSILGWVNVRGVSKATHLIETVTIIKLLPLLVLVLAGASLVTLQTVMPQEPLQPASFARACLFMLFAYFGIESALMPSGEINQPARTVPRAIALGLGGITLLYLGLQVTAQAVLGSSLATAIDAPLASMAGVLFGPLGSRLVLVTAVVSMFGFVAAMMLAAPRVLYALAEDGILPVALAKVSTRYHTPFYAVIVQVILVLSLAVTSSFEKMAIISDLTAVLLYILCAAAAIKLGISELQNRSMLAMVSKTWVPAVALLLMLWLLSSVHFKEWCICLSVLFVASLLYFWRRRS